jgi:NAD(P)-dependent dehydrogenase (short-subunit alcohol dehydrogenase family)
LPVDENLRVAIVTGAGQGIGRATAVRLAVDGLHVVAADRDGEKGDAVAHEIVAAAGRAEPLTLDVTDREAVHAAFAEVGSRLGGIDSVVNCAMWVRYQPLVEMDEETVDGLLAVGLKSVLWTTQAAHPLMKANGGGCIVTVSSPAATKGVPGSSVYSAVKGAVTSITRQASIELAPDGIRVNGVIPGAVPTPGARLVVDEKGYELRRRMTPLGRLGTPEDIAAGISYLLSPDASFVTGHLLAIDGGVLAG